MIYMEPESLGVNPLIVSWMQTIPNNIEQFGKIKSKLQELFTAYTEDTLWFLRRNVIEPVVTMNNNLV